MAKIAIFNFTPILINGEWESVSYYDGIIKALVENGNDVYQFVTSEFLLKAWGGDNKAASIQHKEEVLIELKEYNPDFIISFNHSFIEDADKVLNCPIILWEADAPAYFNDQDHIKANIDRYIFFAFSEFVEREFVKRFGAKKDQVYRIRNATAVRAEKLEKKQNISFIGTCYGIPFVVDQLIRADSKKFYDFLKLCQKFDDNIIKTLIDNSSYSSYGLKANHITDIRTIQKRLQTIGSVADLGLAVFGDSGWANQYAHSLDLAMSYDERLVYSLAHNQDIYNRSKISINVSHAQAITGYPWRVLDILASDSVLVSDPQQDLIDDFGKDVNLQLYTNPYEARELCRKIIADDILRSDIIAQQNEMIDKNFRWEQRFAEMEKILNISLLNQGKGTFKKFKLKKTKEFNLAYNAVTFYFVMKNKLDAFKMRPKRRVNFGLLKYIWDRSPNILKYALQKFYSTHHFMNKKVYESPTFSEDIDFNEGYER